MRTPTNLPTYALALHWAYLTCPDIDLPEPQGSAAILRRLREPCGDFTRAKFPLNKVTKRSPHLWRFHATFRSVGSKGLAVNLANA